MYNTKDYFFTPVLLPISIFVNDLQYWHIIFCMQISPFVARFTSDPVF